MDIAYSEQAAVLLKGSFLPESKRIKDGNVLTVSIGIFCVKALLGCLAENGARCLVKLYDQILRTSSVVVLWWVSIVLLVLFAKHLSSADVLDCLQGSSR